MRHLSLSDCNSQAVQSIRLFVDVLFLGPLLIWIGLNPGKRLPAPLAALLVLTGIATIIFNGVNYWIIAQRKRV